MGGLSQPRPLTDHDDIESFDCGNPVLNAWLRKNALRNQRSGGSRTSLIVDHEAGRIAGFVSLSAAAIGRELLTGAVARNQPDPVPAILLGQLAVDRSRQGEGVARSLLYFALRTSVRIANEVGCVCVATHPIDDAARAFYLHHGFDQMTEKRILAIRIDRLRNRGL